ncbi:MAG TPA: HAMP domain-containing sensor histidine kinase [bacterium]|nr:HAMP domain-containing sensor histidine kinase [bacterium]
MSWNTLRDRLFRSVAFRLTLFYAVLFALVSCAGVFGIYFMIATYLNREIDEEILAEGDELAYVVSNQDIEQVREMFFLETKDEGVDNAFFRLTSSSGDVLVCCGMSRWAEQVFPLDWFTEDREQSAVLKTVTVEPDGRKVRAFSSEITPDKVLQIGIALDQYERILAQFRRNAAVTIVAMLALGTLIGWKMARKVMEGVEDVTRTAERIAQGHLDERVRVAQYGDEIAKLGDTFNRMADRVQKLLIEMREVNDNIAHDLRSPITRIRGISETAIALKTHPSDIEQILGNVVEECDRLLHIINTMLDISEAEAGTGRLELVDIDLGAVVHQAVDLFQPVAEERNISLRAEMNGLPPIRGDLRKIQRALANLIDNALKYTHAGGEVTLLAEECGHFLKITVQDTGVGIPDEDKSRVFERFYRGDSSRTHPGSGLGLSLARAVAHAHGGEITFRSSVGHGSSFSLILPRKKSQP